MITPAPTNPAKLAAYLEWAEVDGSRAPDARGALRQERFAIQAALRSGDSAKIAAARDEALRVVKMWEGF